MFVVAFFGVGAVCGTYWLCTASFGSAAMTAGLALGLLAGAVLLVNNYRDAEADARVGRKRLAIIAGAYVTVWIYSGLMLLPFALLPLVGQALPRGHVWPALGPLPLALVLIYRFIREPRGRASMGFLHKRCSCSSCSACCSASGWSCEQIRAPFWRNDLPRGIELQPEFRAPFRLALAAWFTRICPIFWEETA